MSLWQRLTEPRGNRGAVTRYECRDCTSDGTTGGLFRTPEKLAEHAEIARVTGSHEPGPQRRARRERDRALRQLGRGRAGR
jgi:hypothetical protein